MLKDNGCVESVLWIMLYVMCSEAVWVRLLSYQDHLGCLDSANILNQSMPGVEVFFIDPGHYIGRIPKDTETPFVHSLWGLSFMLAHKRPRSNLKLRSGSKIWRSLNLLHTKSDYRNLVPPSS